MEQAEKQKLAAQIRQHLEMLVECEIIGIDLEQNEPARAEIDVTLTDLYNLIESYAQQIRDEGKLPINFWTRLKGFVEDVQVNDPASEEEKGMIVHVCKKQGGSEQQKCVECGRPMQKKKIIIKGDEDTCDECLCPE